ncbi:unnamed protein product [Schistocephalus solidus]|uniref:Amidase domain-containing protein n=1 Tax=Schistocephalus solidus TaxID=70667 RepID=A0A183SKK6_SCHSO|nr:unnamed protein product [Schistocephalus solidus]
MLASGDRCTVHGVGKKEGVDERGRRVIDGVIISGWVATPSQLHLLQHGVDAEDSGPLRDFYIQDPVLPSQLQYSAEAAKMEGIQLPGLVRVDGPGLRSVKECRRDNGLVQLPFAVQVNTVATSHGSPQPVEGLDGYGGPFSTLIVDSLVA